MFAALLHPVAEVDWLSWSIHWSTVIGVAALAALHGLGTRRLQTSRIVRPIHRLLFITGLLVLFASLNGPIHDLSDHYLFSAHMVQHLLLTMVVPPLLIAGTPGAMLRPLLRHRAILATAQRLVSARAAFVIFSVTLAAWHLPPLYNLAMALHPVHIAQHLCFLVAATIMWWPIMSTAPELPRLSYPQQMLYTVLLTLPTTVISIFITYADRVLYPAYSFAPRFWALSPLDDQRLGGLIMWIPGGLIFLGVLTVVFFRWAGAEAGGEVGEGAMG
ncbi:MAG: cytochrome c oxidase assembly protein [Gemmatimonadaceae bacterium]